MQALTLASFKDHHSETGVRGDQPWSKIYLHQAPRSCYSTVHNGALYLPVVTNQHPFNNQDSTRLATQLQDRTNE